MCCRFRLCLDDIDDVYEIEFPEEEIAEYMGKKVVFPSEKCPVIILKGSNPTISFKKWGFIGYDKKLIINARSETIGQKPTFRPYYNKKCVIPISGFYEWSQDTKHNRYFFDFKDSKIHYLAGIYDNLGNFVVITKMADNEMQGIHNRMPILLEKEEVNSYLSNQVVIENAYINSKVFLNATLEQ